MLILSYSKQILVLFSNFKAEYNYINFNLRELNSIIIL